MAIGHASNIWLPLIRRVGCLDLLGQLLGRVGYDFCQGWVVMGHLNQVVCGAVVIHDGDKFVDEFGGFRPDDVGT